MLFVYRPCVSYAKTMERGSDSDQQHSVNTGSGQAPPQAAANAGLLPVMAPAVQAAPARLAVRLTKLRGNTQLNQSELFWMGGLPGCLIGYMLAGWCGSFIMMLSASALTASSGPPSAIYFLPIIELTAGVVCFFIAYHFAGRYSAVLIKKHYERIWSELWTTNLLPLALEEDYTHQLLERADQIWTLRWISPPPPRTMEQQLEFAACYLEALRRLQRGTARQDNGPLWHGAYSWITGQSRGRTCGCLAVWLLNMVGLALAVLAFYASCQRRAALAAMCDFLMYTDTRSTPIL
jgi:hypothetical protein